jgi:hypothetical protein
MGATGLEPVTSTVSRLIWGVSPDCLQFPISSYTIDFVAI